VSYNPYQRAAGASHNKAHQLWSVDHRARLV
jgi:hypothetical protein